MRTDSPLLLLLGSGMSQKKKDQRLVRLSGEAAWQFPLQKPSEQRVGAKGRLHAEMLASQGSSPQAVGKDRLKTGEGETF